MIQTHVSNNHFKFNSLSHWKAGKGSRHKSPEMHGMTLADRLTNANITGLYRGKGNEAEMSQFFCNHVKNIRKFVSQHPSHALIELDITAITNGIQLESLIGINRNCWGQSNKNPVLHGLESERVPNVCLR